MNDSWVDSDGDLVMDYSAVKYGNMRAIYVCQDEIIKAFKEKGYIVIITKEVE